MRTEPPLFPDLQPSQTQAENYDRTIETIRHCQQQISEYRLIYQGLKRDGNEGCRHAEILVRDEYIDEIWKATSRLEPSQLEGNAAKEGKTSQSMGESKRIDNQRKTGMRKKSSITRYTIERDQIEMCSEICDQLEKEAAGRRMALQ